MKIGILGTGMVGNAIGSKLIQTGHQVTMGSRTRNNEKAAAWVQANGSNASQGTFADAAKAGEVIFNCTGGMVSLDALKAAGAANLEGKVLIDVSNALDFSKGMPPTLSVCNDDSIAEQIQRAFPGAKVVKSLNTMNCNIMVNPSLVPGDNDVFISGNDEDAKEQVKTILMKDFGWKSVIDLGDITSARGVEMLMPLWLRLWGVLKTPNFNYKIVR
jgi:predicted dinucleotide-binding enzyme